MVWWRTIRGKQLYRSLTAAVILALLLLPASLSAQRRQTTDEPPPIQKKKKPKERAPRGVAVVVWRTDAQGKAQPRLLPISIYFENKFIDASLYYAAPRPMALEAGNYFEVQQAGQRIGYFTVENALPPDSSGERRWAGVGEWESAPPRAEFHKQTVAAETVREGTALIIPEPDEQEQERELKRKEVTVYDEQGHPMSKEDAAKPEPDKKGAPEELDRAPSVMKEKPKPKETTTAKPDDDPERPHYGTKKPEQRAPATVTMASSGPKPQAPPDDPDRPVLRRGGPATRTSKAGTSEPPVTGATTVPVLVAERGGEKDVGGDVYYSVAVSDAEDFVPSGDFRYKLLEDERAELTARMSQLAQTEVEKYLTALEPQAGKAKPVAPSPKTGKAGKKGPPQPPYFEEQELRALDVDLNNSAELVFSGTRRSATSAPVFVTVVARVNIEGVPRKLFANVTRADRLDAYPRLALVDAVDADGKGRGHLLFRRIRGPKEEDFVLYRVDPDTLTELFHGGGTE